MESWTEVYNLITNNLLKVFQLQNAGFSLKDASWAWSETEIQQLKDSIEEITKDLEQVHVKDIYYYIAQYKFQGKVPTKVIKKKVTELINLY